MGLFNSVIVEQDCPSCGQRVKREIQFKYGETRQHEYRLGDTLKWGGPDRKYRHPRRERPFLDPATLGGNDIGRPGHRLVVADAMSAACPNCGADGEDCEVWIENDKIVSVKPVSGKYSFLADTYVVVEE